MPTLEYADGFEHQTTSINDFGGDGVGVFDALTNGAQIFVATGGRNGAYLGVSPNAAATFAQKNLPGTDPNISVVSFYLQFPSGLPSVDTNLFRFISVGADGWLNFNSATNKFNLGIAAEGTDVGPALSVGTWYRIDMKYDHSTGTATLDGQIDGGTNVQVSAAAASAVVTSWRFGTSLAVTYTSWFDDFVASNTAGDYPLGAHKVIPLHVSGDGTHSFSPTGDFLRTTTSMAQSDTTGWLEIDDWITGAASDADYIATALAVGTEYVEFTLDDTTETTIWLVTGWGALRAASATACLTIVRLVDSGGAQVGDIYNGDPSETALHYRNINGDSVPALINPTQSTVNGYKLRVFGTADVNPDPWLAAVMLQIAVPEAAGPPPNVPFVHSGGRGAQQIIFEGQPV